MKRTSSPSRSIAARRARLRHPGRTRSTAPNRRCRPRLQFGSTDWFGSSLIAWFRGLVASASPTRKAAPQIGAARPLGQLEPLEPRQLLATVAYWEFDTFAAATTPEAGGDGNFGAVGTATYAVSSDAAANPVPNPDGRPSDGAGNPGSIQASGTLGPQNLMETAFIGPGPFTLDGQSFTFEGWINPAAGSAHTQTVAATSDKDFAATDPDFGGWSLSLSPAATGYTLDASFDEGTANFGTSRDTFSVQADDLVPADTWSHFALMWNHSTEAVTLYVNGEATQPSQSATAPAGFDPVVADANAAHLGGNVRAFGREGGTGSQTFVGKADEWRLSDAGLTPAEFLNGTPGGSPYAQAVLADNPVAYYRFEGNTDDSAGGDDNGTAAGGVTLGQTSAYPDLGAAASFDGGVNAYVDIPTPVTEFGAGSYTVTAWIKTTHNGAGILSKSDNDGSWEPAEKQIYISNSNDGNQQPIGSVVTVGWGTDWISGSQVITDGQWHHVAVTWDYTGPGSGQNASYGVGYHYIDGVEGTHLDNYNGRPDNAGNTVRIGFDTSGEATGNFNGLIDEVAIFNTALSATEIQAQIDAATPIKVSAIDEPSDIVKTGGAVVAAANFGGTGVATVNGITHENSQSMYAPVSFSGPFGDPDGGTFTGDLFLLLNGIAGTTDANEPGVLTVPGLTVGDEYFFQAYWLVKDNFGTRTLDATLEGETLTGIAANPNTSEAVLISRTFTATDDTFNALFSGDGGDTNGWVQGFSLQEVPGDASIYAQAVMADNPVAYYRFEGNTDDSAGGDDNGTAASGVTLGQTSVNPDLGTAASFDGGASAYVDIPTPVTEFGAGSYTVTAWIKTTQNGAAILSKSDNDGSWEPAEKQIYVSNANDGNQQPIGSVVTVGWGTDWISGSQVVTDGQWHHVAVTWDYTGPGSGQDASYGVGHVYIDGVEGTHLDNYNGRPDNAGNTVRIGFDTSGEATGNFSGLIDEVAIYGTALSPAQIQAQFDAATAGSVTAAGVDTTAGANWRTDAQLDIDGNRQYGTDGYFVYGINDADSQYRAPYTFNADQVVLPAYINGITTPAGANMWSGNGNFGQIQDPGNSNALTNTPILAGLGGTQTYTIERTAGAAFRLTVLVASGDGANVTFTTSVSDGFNTETQNAAHTANGLHYHVYDIAAGSGDVTVTIAANGNFQATGFAFDTPGYYADDDWSGIGVGDAIADADLGTAGDQSAVFGVSAFATVSDALDAVSLTTNFDEPTLDTRIGLDVPNSNLGNITFDAVNNELDFSAAGNTDMWGARNNAPIAWAAKPAVRVGDTWSVETEVRINNISQGQQVAGVTFYGGPDGARPDVTFSLDNWNASGRVIKLQGLGDNNPLANVSWAPGSAFLRVEVTENGATDTYNFFYKANAGDAWTQLGGAALNYQSAFPNSRVALAYKTNAAKDGVAFTYFNVLGGEVVVNEGTYGEPVTVPEAVRLHVTGPDVAQTVTVDSLAAVAGATIAIDINGATTGRFDVDGGVTLAGNLDLFVTADPTDEVITLIDNDGTDPTTGTFSGLADGGRVTVGTKTYRIFYNGGDGNDVVLVDAGSLVTVYVDDAWATGVNQHQVITDADLGSSGDQLGVFGVNAFASVSDAVDAVSLTTNFDEPALDARIAFDIPNSSLANIAFDAANDELDISAAGNTDMWTIRNNAPIAWAPKPVVSDGDTWSVETEVRINNLTQNQQVAGITFYGGPDGARPDFMFSLDNWNPAGRAVKLQGLGDNVPVSSVGWVDGSAFLRVEVDENGANDTYNFFYKANVGDAWTQLEGAALNYQSAFPNSRVGLAYKTGGAKDGVAFTHFNVLGGTVVVNEGTYSETVSLSDGITLRVTGPDAAQSVTIADVSSPAGTTIDIQGSSTLTVGDGDDRTIAGTITGSGSFTKQGGGTLTLGGANDYGGLTTVTAGTLVGSSGSLPGDIVNDAAVVFDQGSDGVYASSISGSGSVAKRGDATLTLSGVSTYTGPTHIDAGRLEIGLSSSAAAWYAFDNPANLGLDSGPADNHLANFGTPVYSAQGHSGGALSMNDTANYLVQGSTFPTGVPTGNSAYTISAWVNPTGAAAADGIVGWGNYGAGSQVNALRMRNDTTVHNYWWSNDLSSNDQGYSLYAGDPPAGWHHVLALYDPAAASNQHRIYIDGSLSSQRTPTTAPNVQASNFAIGKTYSTEYFKGLLDDVAIFSRALSATEIEALATGSYLPDTSEVIIDGGTFDIGNFDDTVGDVTLVAGSIIGDGGTLTGSSYEVQDGRVSAHLGGAAELTKTTGGTVALTATQSYTGGTTIEDGTLQLQPVGNPNAWYDATDLATLFMDSGGTTAVTADGQPVGLWADKSGHAIDASQVTAGARPVYASDGDIGGNPVVTFNGADQRITSAFDPNFTSVPDMTMLVVYKKVSDTGSDGLYGQDDGGWDRLQLLNFPANGGEANGISDGSGTADTPGVITTDPLVYSAVLRHGQTNGSQAYINGALDVTFTESHANTGQPSLTFGDIKTTQAFPSNVQIGEILIYSSALDATSRAAAETYLMSKWGFEADAAATDILPDTGALTVSGGTLDIGNYNETVGDVVLEDGQIAGDKGTLTGSSYDLQNGSVSAKLAGATDLVKTTGGTVTLSAVNSYTGQTRIDDGILKLDVPPVANPATWYDATDLATLFQDSGGTTAVTADGQPVGLWTDKSGNAVDAAQGNGGVRPIYAASGDIGGLPVLTFDGTEWITSAFNSDPSSVPDMTMLMVYKKVSDTGGNDGLYGQDNGSWDRLQLLNFPGNVAQQNGVSTGGGTADTPGVITTEPLIYSALLRHTQANGSQVYLNGSPDVTFTENHNPGETSLTFGAINSGGGAAANLQIGEILLYPSALDAASRAAAETYLMEKWGFGFPIFTDILPDAGSVRVVSGGTLDVGTYNETVAEAILESGSTFRLELNGPSPGSGQGPLHVTGNVTLAGSTLDPSLAASFVPKVGESIMLISKAGGAAVTGEFAGLPDGTIVVLGDTGFEIDYQGGDGNDVVLKVIERTTVFVDDAWSGAAAGDPIADADLGTSGAQPATFGFTAFASVSDAVSAVESTGVNTDFSAPTLDANIQLDTPNSSVANITFDAANDELDFSAAGSTNMWANRADAPIAWVAKPAVGVGDTWSVETEVRLNNLSQNQQMAGITFYEGPDAAKPDFTYSLDNWGGLIVRLQGLQDNAPNISVPWTGDSAFLRVEVAENGTTDTYNFFYKANAGDNWMQLGGGAANYQSAFGNSRVGLYYKTGGAKDGAAFTYFNVQGDSIVVNDGDYSETVSLPGDVTLRVTGPDAPQNVTIADVQSAAGSTIDIQGSSTLTVGDGDDRTIAGTITGTGHFTKQGGGTLTLTNSASSFTGNVDINQGSVEASGALLGFNPVTGPLGNSQLPGRRITVNSDASLVFTQHDQLGNAGSTPQTPIVVNGGTVVSRNSLTTVGPVTLDGGTLVADGGLNFNNGYRGAFNLNGTVSVIGDTTSALTSINTGGGGALFDLSNVGSFETTFDVADGAAEVDLLVSGELADRWDGPKAATSLTKTGGGTMLLAGTNTYSGDTNILAGTLRLGLPDGVVAHYTFDDSANLGADSGPLGNDLAAVGTPVYSSQGQTAGALSMDGTANYLSQGSTFPTGIPTGGSSYTISAWVNPAGSPAAHGIVGWGDYGTPSQVNALRMYTETTVHNYWWANDLTSNDPGYSLYAGVPPQGWHHVVALFDADAGSNQHRIYVDGTLSNQRTPGTLLDVGAANFAVGKTVGTEYFNGLLDNVAIFDRPLTDGEIEALYAGNYLPDATAVTVSAGATLDVNGQQETIGSLATDLPTSTSAQVTLGAGTLTTGANHASTTFAGVISGPGGVTKVGNGAQTLTGTNTYDGTTRVEEGSLVAASNAALGSDAGGTEVVASYAPIHRYSFSEMGGAGTTLVDSVGGADATIVDVGGNDGTVGGGQVTLAGGAKGSSDYVALPSGLVSGLTDATIETWATQLSVQHWSRIFDLGGGPDDNLMMSWTQDTTFNSDRAEFTIGGVKHNVVNANQPYVLNQETHIAMTIDDDGGASGETRVRVYKDGVYRGFFDTTHDLAQLGETSSTLGRSQYNDSTANASYNELRIYDVALSDAEVALSYAAGADGGAAELVLDNSVHGNLAIGFESLTLAGTGIADRGALRNLQGDNAFAGQITLSDDARINSDSGTLLLEVLGGDTVSGTGQNLTFGGDGDITVPDPIATGSGGLTKDGTGTLTLSGDNSYDGSTLVLEGTLVAASDTALGSGAGGTEVVASFDPIHRYSFGETGGAGTTLVDSVGGADAQIVNVGVSEGTVDRGQVTLAGGAKNASDYVQLPNGLVSGLTDATIETWATHHSVQNWSRIFSFGSSTTNNLMMSWTKGTDPNSDRVAFKIGNTETFVDNTMRPYTLGQQFHIVMTVDDDGGPAGETQINVYMDGVYQGTLNTNYNLSQLVETENTLGRAKYNDNVADASWDEFRIYATALTADQVAASYAAGPDAGSAELVLDNAVHGDLAIAGESLTLAGSGIANGGALRNLQGDNTFGGPVTLAADARINSDSGTLLIDVAAGSAVTGTGQDLTLGGNGSITVADGITTGDGRLIKDGGGTAVVAGTSMYTRATHVYDGLLEFSGPTNKGGGPLLIHGGEVNIVTGGDVGTTGWFSAGQLSGENGTFTISGTGQLSVNDFNVSDLSGSQGTVNMQGGTINAGNTWIGKATNTVGVMNLADGTFNSRTTLIGAFGTSAGVVNQSGGSFVRAAGGDWRIGGGGGAGDAAAYGSYSITGTGSVLDTGASNFQVGAYGSGVLSQSGGTVISGQWPVIGRYGGSVGVYNLSDGTFQQTGTGNRLIVGEAGTGTLNVGGTGTAELSGGLLIGHAGGATGIVNLALGGTLATPFIDQVNTAASGTFNFHGGTLQAQATRTDFFQDLDAAYVYAPGSVVDTNNQDVTIAQPLLAPTGDGVTGIAMTGGGAGYLAAPIVQISGGGGSGATASAVFDANSGTVTGITITNPGVDYTSSPAVTLIGGGATTPATTGAVTLSANVSGGLTKIGAGELTLSGANSYTGTTTITTGTLSLGGSGEIDESVEVAVAGGAFFDVSGTTSGGYHFAHDVTGTGTVTGALTMLSGGQVQPGDNSGDLAGTLTVDGDFSLNSGATFEIDLSSTASHDQLIVDGGVTLAGDLLGVVGVSTFGPGDLVTIIASTGGTGGTTFNILAEGDTFFVNGVPMEISYTGGAGTDVTLEYDTSPTINADDYQLGDSLIVVRQVGNNLQVLIGTNDADLQVVLDDLLANFTGLTINGGTGDDTLRVDGSGGLIALDDGTVFYGGDRFGDSGDLDAVQIVGGSGTSGSYTVGPGAEDGTLAATDGVDSQQVEFFGAEVPVVHTTALTTFDIHATDGIDSIGVSDGPALGGDATLQVDFDGDFVPVQFAHQATVNVNAAGEADTIDVDYSAAAAGLGTLNVNGGDGSDTLNLLQSTPAGVDTNLNGGNSDDAFVLLDATTLRGQIDGGAHAELGDTLDMRADSRNLVVDLNQTIGAVQDGQGVAIVTLGLAAGATGDVGSSIENVLGGGGNDNLRGDADTNLLGDGAGNDLLAGEAGDDTYQLEPGNGSQDYLMDTGPAPQASLGQRGDRVDFSHTVVSGTQGIVIDMDETGIYDIMEDPAGSVDEVGLIRVNAAGVLEVDASVPSADVRLVDNPQTVIGTSTVTLFQVDEAQLPPAPSPFENVTGSSGNDLIEIDPLATIRYVDGGPGWEPLTYDAGGSEVIDTGRSLTATGIGSIVYDNIEWVETVNASPRIIDNDDPGFGFSGNWGRTVVEGHFGDERFALAGTGNNVATWTFAGVTPGWYRVAATWTAGANRIADAQFTVLNVDPNGMASVPTTLQANGTAATGIDAVNQRAAPNDFSSQGAAWEELKQATPLYFFVTGHELQVQLSDLSASTNRLFSMADAVRVERINGANESDLLQVLTNPAPPADAAREAEIRVLAGTAGSGAAEVTDGFGVQEFGTIGELDSAQRTFTIQNTGLAPLDLTITDVAGDGFTVLPTGVDLPIDAGASMTLTITLDPSDSPTGEPLTGRLYETLSIETNDRDENPFDITVTGFVSAAEPVDAATTLQWVDNDDHPDTFEVVSGDWREIRRDTRFVDNDYRYALGGNQSVQWNLDTGLSGTHLVDVAATWAAGQNRATNATYTVRDSLGNELLKREVNQNLAPDDFENSGSMWEVLGTVRMTTGSVLTVELTTDGANGYVVADAVWVGTSMTPALVVSHDQQELTNNVSVIDLGYVELRPTANEERVITVSSVAGADVDVYLPLDMPAGFSLVQTTDALDLLDGTVDGKVAMTAVGGALDSFDFTVRVGAQAPGNVSGKVSLMSEDPNAAPFQFGLAAQVGLQVVDNADATGFKLSGTGDDFRVYEDPRAYRGSDLYHGGGGSGTNWVDFTVEGLTPGTYYQMSTTWVTGPARASNATYEIYSLLPGAISPLDEPTTVVVDQRVAPDDFYADGEPWEELAVVLATSPAMTVRLTDRGDNWIYADAVRFEQMYLPELEVTIDGRHYESGQEYDFGTVLEQSGAAAVVTVMNMGVLPLQLTLPQLSSITGGVELDSTAFTNTELGTGQSVTFTVGLNTDQMSGDDVRTYLGEIEFTSSDINESVFVLPVRGRVSDHMVIDDGTVIAGQFPRVIRDTTAYGSDYAYQFAGSGNNVIEWTFAGLPAGQMFEVSATWRAGTNRASNAPFSILVDGTTTPTPLNQRLAPDDFGTGRKWEILGQVLLPTGVTTLTVQLTDAADGVVIADAVRVDVPDPLHVAGSELPLGGADPLLPASVGPALGRALSAWQSTGLTAAELNRLSHVEVVVAELPGTVLGLAFAHSGTIVLDATAAGYGWNVDEGVTGRGGEGETSSIDLLTVLAHEMGHILGHAHDDGHAVMAATLAPTRRVSSSSAPTHQLPTSGVSDISDFAGLPKSLQPVREAFTSLAGQTSGVFDTPDFRTPTSEFEKPSDFDIAAALFAGWDERAGSLTDALLSDDSDGERDGEGESDEDALDLWSVLHGFE